MFLLFLLFTSSLHNITNPLLCATLLLHHLYISIMSLLQMKKSCKNETGNLNCCVWFSFTLGLHKWPDSDQCLKWFETMAGPVGPQHLQHLKRPALCMFASLSQHPRNFDVLTAKSVLKSLGCPIVKSCRPLMLLDSNTELQTIMHRKFQKIQRIRIKI